MNLCVNGHDKDVVGVARNRCKRCKHDAQRERRRRQNVCDHPGECVWIQTGRGVATRYCRTKRSWAAKQRQMFPRTNLDGFEDEFGPVPPEVPSRLWFDRVAVQRYLQGEPVGRNLTRGEARGIHLLNVMNPSRSVPAQYHRRGTLVFSDGKRL